MDWDDVEDLKKEIRRLESLVDDYKFDIERLTCERDALLDRVLIPSVRNPGEWIVLENQGDLVFNRIFFSRKDAEDFLFGCSLGEI